MRIQITNEEQSTGFELAFPGTYQATLSDVTNAAGPKGPYAKWSIELLGVDRNSEGVPLAGKKVGRVFETTTLMEGKRWRLAQMAKAAGLNPTNFDTEELVGKQVTVVIDVEKDEGYAPRNVVKKFLAR